MNNTRENIDANFILVNDLNKTTEGYDLVASISANSNKGFESIGGWNNHFTGNFDGNGYTITNLTINRNWSVGLFYTIGNDTHSGTISKLTLKNVNVTGITPVGGLTGILQNGTVENCHVTGNVTGSDREEYNSEQVGGLIGENHGTVKNCSSAVHIFQDGTADEVGGLIGENGGYMGSQDNYTGTVENSYSTGYINGTNKVGGLIGLNFQGTVDNSYSTVHVNGTNKLGGLIGQNGARDAYGNVYSGIVNSSYATGDVIAPDSYDVGGLIGYNMGPSQNIVRECYATGNILGNERVGGLIGLNEYKNSVINSYSTGDVEGNYLLGGLIGYNREGFVYNSYATGDIYKSSKDEPDEVEVLKKVIYGFGGLIGHNEGGTINTSNATGDVIVPSENNVGGLIGYNTGASNTVKQSYATGNVEGNDNVGGLIGQNKYDKVMKSYAVGDVTGTTNVGGLVGYNHEYGAMVTLSYAAGSVSGDTNVGGLVGLNESEATVENSYWDIKATGQDSSAGIGEENGLTTAEMQGGAASSNMEGFDFTNTWFVIDTSTEISYPLLQENTQKSASFSKPKTDEETKSSSSTRTSIGPSQPPETVENTDSTIKKVLAGSNVKYDFSDSEGPVMGIGFDAKDNEGNVVAKVQVLKDKPDDVDTPSANSYKLMSISVGSEGTINEGNADNILIEFKVSKEWIEENNIDPSTIRMTRFNNEEWQDLPSNQVDEDDEYLYFNAETPGFSIFSIIGDEMKEEAVEEEPATEQQSPSDEVEEPVSEEESAQTPGFTGIFAVALIAGAALVMRKQYLI